jgi:hypothetical protein
MIKVNFCDFWPGFEANNLFLKFLEQHFHVSVDDRPDYLFYSVYGSDHLRYDAPVKILYTGENLVPDFNLCDYALGFHYMEFGDRYLRFPLYAYYQWYYDRLLSDNKSSRQLSPVDEKLAKRKFCNFVYSNNVNSDPVRDSFFHELSKYRQVDSGGRHLNNIGGPVRDKLAFIKDYKFTIAFENSSVPGYTTEKLLEPVIARSLPVYYGNPLVYLDFEPGSFVRLENRNDIERVIDEIITLDKDDEKYLEMLDRHKFRPENRTEIWEEKLRLFLKNIFEQPVNEALRRPVHGYNNFYVGELKLQSQLLSRRKRRNSFKNMIKKTISAVIHR